MFWPLIKDLNEDIVKSKGFFHLSFWILFYFFLVLIEDNVHHLMFVLVSKLVHICFYIFIVYTNILYLIPTFLQRRNFLKYFFFLVLLVSLTSPIHDLIYILLYNNSPGLNVVFSILLLVGLASTAVKVTSDWLLHQKEKRELESQTLQSELKFLKSQINPHFFFNTLNNLYALTLKKSDLAPEIVLRLSEMMRYMLYESNEKKVALEKEINYVINYIELEKLRQGKNIDISFELEGLVKNQRIAPLMFIPFLENSFKHGVDTQIKSGHVNIKLTLDDDKVELDIENSKPQQVQVRSNKKSGGIGLENVKRRLMLLYPQKHSLNIIDNAESFRVLLNIELV